MLDNVGCCETSTIRLLEHARAWSMLSTSYTSLMVDYRIGELCATKHIVICPRQIFELWFCKFLSMNYVYFWTLEISIVLLPLINLCCCNARVISFTLHTRCLSFAVAPQQRSTTNHSSCAGWSKIPLLHAMPHKKSRIASINRKITRRGERIQYRKQNMEMKRTASVGSERCSNFVQWTLVPSVWLHEFLLYLLNYLLTLFVFTLIITF